MGSRSWIRRTVAAILATGFVVTAMGVGREARGQAASEGERNNPIRVAERSNTPTDEPRLGGGIGPAQNDEHPLMPVLRWGQKSIKIAEAIQDYSATLVKRERHDGKLQETEYMFIKVRHKPLSVYIYFLKPDHFKGQEVIWIQGQNNGKMWGHGTGMRKVFGTVPLDPTGPIAMRGNRYPITEIGILNLVRRLVEEGEKDTHYGECEVKYFQGAKLNGRSCTCIQVVHPVPRKNFQFHIARIFVDDEYNLPVRFEAHDWPSSPGGPPELIEEYTYLNLKFNNGFTDADFDIRNPNYGFSKPR